MTVIDLIGDLLILAAAATSTTFTLLYMVRSRWRANMAGRALLYLALLLTVMLTWTAVTIFIVGVNRKPYPMPINLFRDLLWLGGVIVLTNMVRALLRAQRLGVRRRRR